MHLSLGHHGAGGRGTYLGTYRSVLLHVGDRGLFRLAYSACVPGHCGFSCAVFRFPFSSPLPYWRFHASSYHIAGWGRAGLLRHSHMPSMSREAFLEVHFGRASGESTFGDLAWTDLETRFVFSVFLPSGADAQDTIVRCTSP